MRLHTRYVYRPKSPQQTHPRSTQLPELRATTYMNTGTNKLLFFFYGRVQNQGAPFELGEPSGQKSPKNLCFSGRGVMPSPSSALLHTYSDIHQPARVLSESNRNHETKKKCLLYPIETSTSSENYNTTSWKKTHTLPSLSKRALYIAHQKKKMSSLPQPRSSAGS